MGYSFSVYAIDLKKLRKVWGKKDTELLSEIREEHADDISDNDESFEDDIIEGGAPIVARALYEILAGKPEKKDHGFQYGYALELLCKHLGERVDEESLTWFDDILDPLLKKAKCPKTELLLGAHVLPLKIPMPNDFPEIGTVEPNGCIAGLGVMQTIAPLAKGNDDAKMVIDEVTGWFDKAKKAKAGLVWFVY